MADSPVFFENTKQFREWLERNHQTASEIIVGYYKVATGKPTMTWSESVDEALCFGWIDGIRKSIDEESYCNRFTPRKPKSNWSAINIKKVEELIKLGKMTQAGLAAFEKRREDRSAVYSYENEPGTLPADLEAQFKLSKTAWDFFERQAPSYRKAVVSWILSGKQEQTRWSRLEKLIAASQSGKRIY